MLFKEHVQFINKYIYFINEQCNMSKPQALESVLTVRFPHFQKQPQSDENLFLRWKAIMHRFTPHPSPLHKHTHTYTCTMLFWDRKWNAKSTINQLGAWGWLQLFHYKHLLISSWYIWLAVLLISFLSRAGIPLYPAQNVELTTYKRE